jgi:putative acetyltransferase
MMRSKMTYAFTIDAAFVAELFKDNLVASTSHECGVSVVDRFNHHASGGISSHLTGIRKSRSADRERILDIWRGAVDETHHFLHPGDRRDIEVEVVAFLPKMSLWLAVNCDDMALGFTLLDGCCMEALFIHPEHRGLGIGRALVQHALSLHSSITTEVNEQNLQAIGFYRHLGFERIGYSQHDQQGRPYPLIHLRKSRESV